jgi:tetratricopeptide (TPR) repeat protein
MKRLVVLFILFISGSFAVSAQPKIDSLRVNLEQIKVQNGEKSNEYLSAIDQTIQAIAGYDGAPLEHLHIAADYRKQHLNIVAKMKGEYSVEYAEDLFRLGNTYRRLGNTDNALSLFQKSCAIFEQNQCWGSEFFELTTYMASLILRQQQQYEKAIEFQEKCVKCTNCRYGVKDMRHIETCDLLLRLAGETKRWDIIKQYSRQVFDNIDDLTKDNFKYYSYAMLGEHTWLWVEERYSEAIEVYKRYLDKVKKYLGDNSMEYVEGLKSLTVDYRLVGKYSDAIASGEEAVKIIENLYNNDQSLLYKDTIYYEVCNALYNVYGIITDKRNKYKYNCILLDILKSENKTDSDEYHKQLIYAFNDAVDIGEYNYALSIAADVEKLIPQYSKSPDEDLYYFFGSLQEVAGRVRDYNTGIDCTNKRLALLPKLASGDTLSYNNVDNYIMLSQLYYEAGTEDKAQMAIELAERECASIKNMPDLEVKELFACLYQAKGRVSDSYDVSLQAYAKALNLFEQLEPIGE